MERQPDTSSPRDTSSEVAAVPDTTPDAPSVDTVADTGVPETAEPDTQTTFCSPGTTLCSDADTLSTCRADGSAIDATTCAHGCVAGACAAPPQICVPSTSTCKSYDQLDVCSADGTSSALQSCAPGRCLSGACTSGSPTAAPCTADADCLGGTCYCAGGTCGSSALAAGYCTSAGCDTLGCGSGELCVYVDPASPICVKDCTACTQTGFACGYRPALVGGERSWAQACFVGNQAGIGGTCVTDAECVGGMCLHTSPNGNTITAGYCSAPCATQAACPANAKCVAMAAYLSGAGFCALACVDDGTSQMICPPERPSTFAIDCFSRAPADGGFAVSVCFQL